MCRSEKTKTKQKQAWKYTGIQAGGQADIQTGIQAGTQADRQTDEHTGRKAGIQTGIQQTGRKAAIQAGRLTGIWQSGRQAYIQADKHTSRQADLHAGEDARLRRRPGGEEDMGRKYTESSYKIRYTRTHKHARQDLH